MTKDLRRLLGAAGTLALAILLAVPAVEAHGAPPVREVDTRVLLDDDGLASYGGCVEGQCQPVAPAEGLDLLALDAREAALPDGSPAIVLRVLVQSDAPRPGADVTVSFLAGGSEWSLQMTTEDGLAYTSSTFERVDGPFDVGDGHPKAIDGWIRHAALGVAPGDALTGIRVVSSRGETLDDAMPGGWYSNGVEVPHLPHDADPGEATAEPSAGELRLKGAAPLVGFAAEPVAPDLSAGPATVQLRLTNPVGLPQFCDLALLVPPGVTARLGQPGVSLDANGQRDLELFVSNATADGVVQVTLVSDLGAYETANVTVRAPPSTATASMSGQAPVDPEPSKESPSSNALLPLLVVLALGAFVRARVTP
jgi:hypothetical protein